MNAKQIAIQELLAAGYQKGREGANHELYYHPATRNRIPVRHHFTDQDLKVIRAEIKRNARKEAGE